MCNIAGYIGGERAAPILLDMIERQEGWGGGYYTGIATLCNGRIHMRKVVGDTARLRAQTDAENLPGTTGIVHSRSNSGGDREWAHPFLSHDSRIAYVANGHQGAFAERNDADRVWTELRADGYRFASRVDGPVGDYPRLKDGTCIHISDLMCGLIHAETRRAGTLVKGLSRAFAQFPSEIVGLAIDREDPEAVTAGRINMPMMIRRETDAVYLATTAMAFPDCVDACAMPVPPNAAMRVTVAESLLMPLRPAPAPVTGILPWMEGEHAIRNVLNDGKPHPFGHMSKAVEPFFQGNSLHPKALFVYELLRKLHHQKHVVFENHTVPGVTPELTAPQLRARMA